ncbi:hypothetical protein CcCBS67573_g01049 [Chytriomyces confervae]|uniref:Uncharacterized protein n=1 Tax=Chytriomyces confervae TaxID=246404 RepID=A0A507FMZ9_9FUNG|nr:hypothetical protein HDU80_011461 [Chytriomyces hyalinus]TPX77704.1 hypothetical protein CcCBS67573_g01049 [Chytriomyces confervae]
MSVNPTTESGASSSGVATKVASTQQAALGVSSATLYGDEIEDDLINLDEEASIALPDLVETAHGIVVGDAPSEESLLEVGVTGLEIAEASPASALAEKKEEQPADEEVDQKEDEKMVDVDLHSDETGELAVESDVQEEESPQPNPVVKSPSVLQAEDVVQTWFTDFEIKSLTEKVLASKDDGEFVDAALTNLLTFSIGKGGGAVARTAKAIPELIWKDCVSVDAVKRSLVSFTKTLSDFGLVFPNVFKYFGIIYGVMMVEFEEHFTLKDLAVMVNTLIHEENAAEELRVLKVVRQVLEAVSVMKGEKYLTELYKRQQFDLKYFWPAGRRVEGELEDWLESNSFDCLLEVKL